MSSSLSWIRILTIDLDNKSAKNYSMDMGSEQFKELDVLLKIYRRNPQSKIFAPLSEMYRKNGLVDEAKTLCERGLSFHPDYLSGKMAYAALLLDSGEFQEALSMLQEVLVERPHNILAHKLLIKIYTKLGLEDKVAEVENELLKINPYFSKKMGSEKQQKLKTPSKTESIEGFQVQSIQNIFSSTQNPVDKKYYTLSLAQVYEKQGHFDKALHIYEDLCNLYPDKEDFFEKKEVLKKQLKKQSVIPNPPSEDERASQRAVALQNILKNIKDIKP